MTLAEILRPYIAACFTGIWIESDEHQDALIEIGQLCRQEEWRLAIWDLEQRLRIGAEQAATASSDHRSARGGAGGRKPGDCRNPRPAASRDPDFEHSDPGEFPPIHPIG